MRVHRGRWAVRFRSEAESPVPCSVAARLTSSWLTLKQAADGSFRGFQRNETARLRPNGYARQAVFHSVNMHPNPAELCEKLPALLTKCQSPIFIQNEILIETLAGWFLYRIDVGQQQTP